MKTTTLQQRPLSPRTRQQQQSRIWSMVVLLLFLGPIAVISGAILCELARAAKRPRAFAWLALAGVVGLALLVWRWRSLYDEVLTLGNAAMPLVPLLRPKPNQTVDLRKIGQALATLWPFLWLLWRQALLLAPLVASYIHSAQVQTAEDLERARHAREERAAQAAIHKAAVRSAKAPAAANGAIVLGVPLSGDLEWEQGGWFTYPAAILGRHLVMVGGSGTGKTETSKRIAYGAAKVYGWKVFYLDCKGDVDTAAQFMEAMRAAGRTTTMFPTSAYDGWRGDTTALLNRLISIIDYSEPYYRDITKMMLSLAVEAPPAPPRSSSELLARLNLDELALCYAGLPEARELAGIRPTDAQAAYNRYRAFFKALHGGLDGGWAFEDVEAGYILLKGLELKDQTASLGRYILEDFAHYVSTRKARDDRVLLIVDEFPAIAFGGANAASLFEMVRSHGAGIAVTAQSYAGMGEDADRILGAAAGLIVHQCADPERLLTRAGQDLTFERRVSFSERGMGQAVKEFAVGEGMLAARQELKVSPDRVKQLGPGECFVIVGGCAQEVRVSQVRLPKQHDTVPAQDTKAQSAIEGINEQQRRAYRQAREGVALPDTIPDQKMPAETDANILTIGIVPALPSHASASPAPFTLTGQDELGESEARQPDKTAESLQSGDQA
jgi:hypothetical protein